MPQEEALRASIAAYICAAGEPKGGEGLLLRAHVEDACLPEDVISKLCRVVTNRGEGCGEEVTCGGRHLAVSKHPEQVGAL